MPTAVTVDDYLVLLAGLTTLSVREWSDFLSLAPEDQALAAEAYRACSWVQTPDTFAEVLRILQIVGTIAGVVGGLAGAGGAVVALKNLL